VGQDAPGLLFIGRWSCYRRPLTFAPRNARSQGRFAVACGDEQHAMSVAKRQPAEPKPGRQPLQYSLRTLLLLFVVLGSSLAVFGA